jgi:hypothetical protein
MSSDVKIWGFSREILKKVINNKSPCKNWGTPTKK